MFDVALEMQEGAGVDAVHHRAVGERELSRRDLFDDCQPIDELADEHLQRFAHIGRRDCLPDQIRAVALGKIAQFAQHLVPVAIEWIAVAEQLTVGRKIGLVQGQHQLLDLAQVGRAEHPEEAPDLPGRLAVVIGIDDRGDLNRRIGQQRGNQRCRAASAVNHHQVQHLFAFQLAIDPRVGLNPGRQIEFSAVRANSDPALVTQFQNFA